MRQPAHMQNRPLTTAGETMNTVRQTILVITCVLVMVGFAPSAQVDESDDGLFRPTAMVATVWSNAPASRGRSASCAPACNMNSVAEGVVLSPAPSQTISKAYADTPDHSLEFLCLLRC